MVGIVAPEGPLPAGVIGPTGLAEGIAGLLRQPERMKAMAGFGELLKGLAGWFGDRRGVTAAEYAILAVGVVIVVGAAVVAFELVNPLKYAGTALTSGQASLNAVAR